MRNMLHVKLAVATFAAKCVYLVVLSASVLLMIHLVYETRRLRNQVQHLEEERRRTAFEAIDPGILDIPAP